MRYGRVSHFPFRQRNSLNFNRDISFTAKTRLKKRKFFGIKGRRFVKVLISMTGVMKIRQTSANGILKLSDIAVTLRRAF